MHERLRESVADLDPSERSADVVEERSIVGRHARGCGREQGLQRSDVCLSAAALRC
jgi:hypothetical protein